LVDYAARIVGSRAHAEDVVQEAYVRFSVARENGAARQGEPILQPLAYLYAIVRNLALSGAQRSSLHVGGAPAEKELAALASDAPSAETVLVHRDELRTLAAALVELPERTRLAFNMHRIEGLPLREVADRLDISVSRAHQLVKTAMIHGARRLRERQP
jgi:RNA polymerase sigma-70 factor (ECF subfamily)